jgi:enoyl-[acyl-carrier protein] reductase II
MDTRVTTLFGICYPIIQAGMVWASGWKLCVAVARTGCLGQIGSGSMKPDLLREHIQKARVALGDEVPFAVNVPLQRGDAAQLVDICVEERVKHVFTSAGNPGLYTAKLKVVGAIVTHVVPSARLAKKAEERGVDAVVCEGFEAGGHDGVEEITTFVLIPQVRDAVKIPVIAAGGIVNGRGIAAALALGADGVQIGTRFAVTTESSAHERYKLAVLAAGEADTVMSLRPIGPVRTIRNPFAKRCVELEQRGGTPEEMRALLGDKRERLGIFEGNWEEGQFEAGMGAGMIRDILPAADVVKNLLREFREATDQLRKYGQENE